MYLKLAWRNIWRNKRRTLITLSSILFAVVCALFIESIERGSHDLTVENMTRFHTGYLQVQDFRFEDEPSLDNSFYYDPEFFGSIEENAEGIEFTVPRIDGFMLAAGEELTRPAMVLGILPGREQRLNGLVDRLVEGRFFNEGESTAVVSQGLASRLNVAVGDTLVLLGQGRFGMSAAGKYYISGIVKLPLREMDNQTIYLSLSEAQWLLSAEGYITSLLITPESAARVNLLAEAFSQIFEGTEYRVLTWREMMPELIEALEFDKAGTRMFMAILYVVIGFGIFGTILTMTLERLREFGILLSVGMKRMKLAAVVFIETLLISILGVLSGFGLGLFLIIYFNINPITIGGDGAEYMLDMGFDPILPTAIAPDIFFYQGSVVFLITLVISLYPSFKILRLNILEAAKK